MCGIAGIIDFRGGAISADVLDSACADMRHRGPDDAGTFLKTGDSFSIGLAAVRLAILDPTPAGRQPFLFAAGRYVLVYNGEVYNYRLLRAELAALGDRFSTDTDTEVVAAACARWGPGALDHFNGMWALAFFDCHTCRGFFARDRCGVKPLLFAGQGPRLYFASEMRTLRMLGDWDRRVHPAALLHYLRYGYFAAPDTIYAAATRLGPGEYVPFDASGPQDPVRWYDPVEAARERPVPDYSTACTRVRTALGESVARRRVADVPVGTFLSGGVDSSIVALHLAECTPGPIETFSIGYVGQDTYDETEYARLMARHLGSRHHALRLTQSDVLDGLPAMLDHLGEPFFDSSLLPAAVVSQLARQQVTVCLSGDGGDELFGGYWRYLGHAALAGYRRWPRALRRGVVEPFMRQAATAKSSILGNRVRQMRKLLRAEGCDAVGRHLAWARILAPEAQAILAAEYRDDVTTPQVAERFAQLTADLPANDELNRILVFDLQYGLPGDMLHKVDLASMYHSLEVRVPFLDPEVVETVLACPAAWKVRRGVGKRLLIDAYRGHLPDAILDRPKMGFEVPIGEYLRDRLADRFRATVTPAAVASLEVLDYAGIERVYADHCARRGEHGDLLFALLVLCHWRQRGG